MMRLFDSLEIAGSSLTAHRLWMDLISQNLANVNTTRTPEGGPYKRRVPVFAERLQDINNDFKGVGVERIEADDLPPRMVINRNTLTQMPRVMWPIQTST